MEKGKSSAKKILSIIGNTLIWLFVAFSVVITVLAFAAQASTDGIPTIGGTAILTVQSPSMEPTFNMGDIIIGKKLTEEQKAQLKVDDIITFAAGDLNGDGKDDLNTHRIIEVNEENGAVTYITKGDNNAFQDNTPVRSENVVCLYKGTRIQKLGTFLAFLQQPTGFLVVIVLPLLAFFIYELIIFIRKFLQVKNGDKRKITAEEEELIKQKAIEEYLRSQQQNAEKKPEEDGTEEPKAQEPSETAEEPKPEEASVSENTETETEGEPSEGGDAEEKKPEETGNGEN